MITQRCLVLLLLTTATSLCSAQIVSDPPIISEFLPDPSGKLETEWIELYNPHSDTVHLHAFQIGDSWRFYGISDTILFLPPYEYIILTWEVDRFFEYYNDFDGRITSPSEGWPTLNNDGDVVRLADWGDRIVDSAVYETVFGDNRSWEVFINANDESIWGGSFSTDGSSPGELNSFFSPRISSIDLDITPDPFSPNGDGFEDFATISFNPPEAESLELVVYDISGRKLKTFREGATAIPGEIVWDGRDDSGRYLPVGIYIVYASVEGGVSMSVKKTVVIAR
ncbi:MAG: hypothetical protein GY841_02060 [FCB group bacterium]|nr:hypothetical protein [FCB group bacterium]